MAGPDSDQLRLLRLKRVLPGSRSLALHQIALQGPRRESVQRLVTVAIVVVEQVVEVRAHELAERLETPCLERIERRPPTDVRRL